MGILEELSQKLGCEYLSDLHKMPLSLAAQNMIASLPEDAYSLAEFSDAANYLAGTELQYDTPAAAKQAMLGIK